MNELSLRVELDHLRRGIFALQLGALLTFFIVFMMILAIHSTKAIIAFTVISLLGIVAGIFAYRKGIRPLDEVFTMDGSRIFSGP